ncbi:MAG: hypothetical protein H6981_11910 [Gammaproteobacteria bacterium]|nr:hypothetical protein [Gammaproteobacteria bacterium]MCP5137493.1 hypothetical protein [Gammaproteobacteria bacterium]
MRPLILIFLLGWGFWFWLDKQGPAYLHAAGIEAGDDTVRDFQAGFDLLKANEPGAAFAFLWYHHYFLMTALIAVIAGFALPQLRIAALRLFRQIRIRIQQSRSSKPG